MAGNAYGGWGSLAGAQDTLDPTFNEITGGAVVPAAGFSVAAMATGVNKRFVTASGSSGDLSTSAAGPGGGSQTAAPAGNLFGGLAVFVALLIFIMWVAHRTGDESEFSNIRASFFNVVLISLVALAGLPLWKMGTMTLSEWKLPFADNLNAWAQAA
jgi:hypothetical protein